MRPNELKEFTTIFMPHNRVHPLYPRIFQKQCYFLLRMAVAGVPQGADAISLCGSLCSHGGPSVEALTMFKLPIGVLNKSSVRSCGTGTKLRNQRSHANGLRCSANS